MTAVCKIAKDNPTREDELKRQMIKGTEERERERGKETVLTNTTANKQQSQI